jgi:NADPH2:quinone reductase
MTAARRTHAIRVHQFGGPEVLRYEEVDVPAPAAGEALVRHTAIGLNFIDTYHRSGLYPLSLPAGIGCEAAGVIEAVGQGVTHLAAGDRVAYVGLPPGAYAGARSYGADRMVRLPDGISDDVAASVMLKGLTAWYLLRRSHRVTAGEPILVYAAAGGTGQLVCQWAASLGARVIGVAGTVAKAALARSQGCAEVILADDPDFVARVKAASGGGVAAVYDSVGRDTFMQSLDCLRPHGIMVSYGNASGPVAPFSPMELAKRGSLHLTRPSLFDFIKDRAGIEAGTAELFAALTSGAITVRIDQHYALADAARAHQDLESRRTTGATVLRP